MKIGLAQTDIVWEQKERNQKACIEFFRQGKEAGVELLIFPEMTLTGFSMNTDKIKEEHSDSPSLIFFQNQAKYFQIAVCFGMSVTKGEKAVNKLFMIDEWGNILTEYEKIHPFSFGAETKNYIAGQQLCFCKIKEFTVSPLICYDLRFPEIFQAVSLKSQLIIVIANWPIERIEHWKILLQARAIENQCFIAGVNRIGQHKSLYYTGQSTVVNPYGDILVPYTDKQQLLIADIDIHISQKYRQEFPLKNDRRTDLYTDWYQKSNS